LKGLEKDFAMKKDLDNITKLNPDRRYNNLRRFLDTIQNNEDSKNDLNNWQMEFKNDVIKLNAVQQAPVTVQFGNVRYKLIFFNQSN
jgi:hypothetical protein